MTRVLTDGPPLRVLHLLPDSGAGGVSRYVFDLAFAMARQGHGITIAGEVGDWHWLFETAPFPWIVARTIQSRWPSRPKIDPVSQWLEEHPVDLLHVHDLRCMPAARMLQQRWRVPVLFTLHEAALPWRWPWSAALDFGDHVHVASKEDRQWLLGAMGLPHDLISLVPHGVDPVRFPTATPGARAAAREALGIAPADLVAAYVGRMDSPKNETWMLDLADQSRETLPDLKVLLVGQGPHEAMLKRRVRRRKLKDRAVLLGYRDPLPIYQAADALLLPSQREGFSLVCAEAMSTGIPVLRTRTAGTDALVVENSTGKSVDIDKAAFVNGAIEFLSDREKLQQMGQLAALHVHQHFTFDRQLHDTVDLYRALMQLFNAPLIQAIQTAAAGEPKSA